MLELRQSHPRHAFAWCSCWADDVNWPTLSCSPCCGDVAANYWRIGHGARGAQGDPETQTNQFQDSGPRAEQLMTSLAYYGNG